MSKIFNDPIHGRIEIPDYCIKIIDTPHFQRLRYLHQLGIVYLVFHGATHTRFEHSIGVCWLAGKWIRHFQTKQPELQITEREVKIVQIAALVHDLGHGPFSHTFERFINRVRPEINFHHESMSVKIFEKIYNDLDYHTIAQIINGKYSDERLFLAQIVNNTINGLDSDKLDYFIRDSQCTSFKIGCDPERIIHESRVINNEICFPTKLIGDIWNIYQTRFRLYKDLYYHKTVNIMEDMLLDAMVLADKNVNTLSKSIDKVDSFIQITDNILLEMGKMEPLVKIQTRNLEVSLDKKSEKRIAHYGMGGINPLTKVKFFNKLGEITDIRPEIINTMCPTIFTLEI